MVDPSAGAHARTGAGDNLSPARGGHNTPRQVLSQLLRHDALLPSNRTPRTAQRHLHLRGGGRHA